MAIYCTSCGTQNPEASAFCSNCGAAMPRLPNTPPPPPPVVTSTTTGGPTVTVPAGQAGLSDNAAGAIAYITFIPAIIFLLIEPYNRSRFVRFHSWQSIWLSVAWWAVSIVFMFPFMPGMFFVHFGLRGLLHLVLFVAWLIALINAAQGKMFKLPVIGDLAEGQAGKA